MRDGRIGRLGRFLQFGWLALGFWWDAQRERRRRLGRLGWALLLGAVFGGFLGSFCHVLWRLYLGGRG